MQKWHYIFTKQFYCSIHLLTYDTIFAVFFRHVHNACVYLFFHIYLFVCSSYTHLTSLILREWMHKLLTTLSPLAQKKIQSRVYVSNQNGLVRASWFFFNTPTMFNRLFCIRCCQFQFKMTDSFDPIAYHIPFFVWITG